MEQYIEKSALVAEIKRRMEKYATIDVGKSRELDALYGAKCKALMEILSFLDTLEVKEVGISIPNIDNLFEENGIDPNSKVAKNFKESYYTALENFKPQKGE